MDQSFQTDGEEAADLQVLLEDSEFAFCRRANPVGAAPSTVFEVFPVAEHPSPAILDRLAHEFDLKDELDGAWAARPIAFNRENGRSTLTLEDRGGEPLKRLLGSPMKVEPFLSLAVGITAALGKVHQAGLIHKDIKPANIIVGSADGHVRLTGFGIASRLSRERQAPEPPETIAGTLAYMAPEQTGRMNRSIDSRSDLYSLGMTLYEMLTGGLPFAAVDALEWVHCHIARSPIPPHRRMENIPSAISTIIMKLLAKAPEERYQTASGVEHDLRRCLSALDAHGRIGDFPPGQRDAPDRLLIPERLYGREQAIRALLSAYDRVVAGGRPELVLVSGYSGIGKSAVVNELHKALVPPRGLFAAGKFDQYKRDIPYATLAQAFQGLIRTLLSKSEDEVRHWRASFHEALHPNGQLMVSLVPELETLIGKQPSVADLPPREAQALFHAVFRRFIAVFAQPEHPLALFLDDLQWLDAATLDLVEDLLTHPDVKHLLLIGAYRDNEVGAMHPLARKLEAMRQAGALLTGIVLAPLTSEDLQRLVSDSLHCDAGRARPLAELIHDRTGGNPFFAIQFISALSETALLTFDRIDGQWSWDLDGIRAKGYTDNVVDLMVSKLGRLAPTTRNALTQLACLGHSANFATIRSVGQDTMEQMHAQLIEAVRAGFILRAKDSYSFLHDRVREAAYSLIPTGLRASTHLRIGMLLAAHTPPDTLEDDIFDIVNQLNNGLHLITSIAERERVAELNLVAGKRAKISTAYDSALKYLRAGRELLTDETWSHNYDLIFGIECLMAECELLNTDMAAAEDRLSILAERTNDFHGIALVTRLRLTLYQAVDRSDRAVAVFIEFMRRHGANWVPHPTEEEVRQEYDQVWSLLEGRAIEQLVDLPLIDNPDVLDVLDVFTEVVTPALYTDQGFLALTLCRMVSLSLQYGNCDGSCYAYVWLGLVAGPHFGDYQAGFRFGQLGYDLVEARGLYRYQARTYMCFGCLIVPWTKHVKTGRELIRRCFDAANRIGDLTYAGYSRIALNTNLLAAGDPLGEAQREAEIGLEFATAIGFGLVMDCITAQLGLIRTLRGQTTQLGTFNDECFDEFRFEHHLASNPVLALPECWYWIRKLQARFFSGDYASAIEASLNAERLLWTSPSFFDVAEYHFYTALARAAAFDSSTEYARQRHLQALAAHQKQHEIWTQNCPETFENRTALIGAEIARIEGRVLEAEQLYEQAIRSSRINGFVHNEALANELAARFYEARGFPKIAHAYLRDARYAYLRWGAGAKVQQLDALYPHLGMEGSAPTGMISAPVGQLDLATVIKVSQAISGEIVLDRLLETLMRMAIEQAGAERGLLILSRARGQSIAAEAVTKGETVVVDLRDEPVTASALPETVLQYVLRTGEDVVLGDALRSEFAADPYLGQRQARSILCLPLLNRTRIIGVLFLENNLTPGAFGPARIAVLKLLSSLAAVSLENGRLYRDLEERESRIRRLVESNVVGIVIWDLNGWILDANDAFLNMVQYEREDLQAGLRWFDMTPPEWQEAHARYEVEELETTGMMQAREKEFFRKDGSRVPVLIGAASFEGQPDQGVAYIVDLTARKRAEEAARASEQRYRETQMELAHANRVATLGQLTGSIAHEVSQPLAATVASAQAAMSWLEREPPDLARARRSLARVVEDGERAGEVVHRTRALIKKAPLRQDRLEINAQVGEVIALTRGEARQNRVSVEADLGEGLPHIRGDRVQLQQVMLNLVINAIEAMSATGDGKRDLVIGTGTTDLGDVLVTVRDSGPGLMPAGGNERIFDAFYTTKATGLGMGLSICRSIIEAHGGRLWASPNEPRGAVFRFTLPPCEEGASTKSTDPMGDTAL